MRVFVAFIISLLIYVLLIWLYVTKVSNVEVSPHKRNNHVVKIDIRNIPLPKKAPIQPKPIPKKTKIEQPKPKEVSKVITPKPKVVPKKKPIKKKPIKKRPIIKKKPHKKRTPKKKIIKKKIVKKRPVHKKKRIPKKKIIKKRPKKKQIPKKKPKIIKKKKPSKKKVHREEPIVESNDDIIYIPEPFIEQPKVIKESSDLGSFLSSSSQPTTTSHSYPNKKIKKLYGSSFHNMTPTQKRFIEDNLDSIQEITQRTLTRRGYPQAAAKTGQEGTNVVSFNLHPNGDISNLRLKTRIGYRSLDENTLSLIRVAYKDYPYPKTTTKIVFYVTYTIYGY